MATKFDCIVVGAGASGMIAAIMAARNGKKIALIESKSEPGKKILTTGNGKCNYTNLSLSKKTGDYDGKDYPIDVRAFVISAFKIFGYEETIDFFKSIGIYPDAKGDYVYPYSHTALSLRNALWDKLKALNVEIITSCKLIKVEKANTYFKLLCKQENKENSFKEILFEAKKVVLATGSNAAPKTGSDGSGLDILKGLGLTSKPFAPALVKLLSQDRSNKMAAGVRHRGRVAIYTDRLLDVEEGELQFTEDGISGIPIFQLSRYASEAIKDGKKVELEIDLLPDITKEEVKDIFENVKTFKTRSLTNAFSGLFPAKLVKAIADKSSISSSRKIEEISEDKLFEFLENAKKYKLDIHSTGQSDTCQVAMGGLLCEEVKVESMEVEKISGLYVVGELLNVDGKCGGFNLQWAWTSGALAGLAISREE